MRTVILGLDAYDPRIFERLANAGRLPNLSRLVGVGGYRRFGVSAPPQSEVSWSSIATGLNPGHHGIYDFVHRDPKTYKPYVSLLRTTSSLVGTQFVPPYTSRTLFETATRRGYPATVLWWPAMFPGRPQLSVQSVPGLGTPDILGRLGVGFLFVSDTPFDDQVGKVPVFKLESQGQDRFVGTLPGPARASRDGVNPATLDVTVEALGDDKARVRIADQQLTLRVGAWSPILSFVFKLGLFARVGAVTRVIVTRTKPDLRLYILPLQIHPLKTPWRYGNPRRFSRQLWKAQGPFLTLGMPQDTPGLEAGCIDEGQFLALCDQILADRERILMAQLESFDEGVIASVFDSLDRIQHVFWRDRKDIVEAWYVKLDRLVGRVRKRLVELGLEDARVVVVSDHGIAEYEQKVHLNRWLMDRGYLKARDDTVDSLSGAVWSETKAYALGLNGLYLNLEGRESQGIVAPESADILLSRLVEDLEAWEGPVGAVVNHAWRSDHIYQGPNASQAPDLVVGYRTGYRASPETGLGRWKDCVLEPNRDRWNADHCIDPEEVPGVLFSSRGLMDYPHPTYRDFPMIAIDAAPDADYQGKSPEISEEDDSEVEERLKGLGYL